MEADLISNIHNFEYIQSEIVKIYAQINELKLLILGDAQSKDKFYNKHFIFDEKERKSIDIEQIVYIKAESNYSTLFLTSGQKIFTSKTLKHWLDTFHSPALARVHKSHAVNKSKIISINKSEKSLLLSGNHVVNFSRNFKFN